MLPNACYLSNGGVVHTEKLVNKWDWALSRAPENVADSAA